MGRNNSRDTSKEMVLWEVTLATAYVLGLKRTYKLALRLQRRLITQRHPAFRQFVQRRTRAVFDVVLHVHKRIRDRDTEMGNRLGNWILQRLDQVKPSANIRGDPPSKLLAHLLSTTKSVQSKPHARLSSFSAKHSMLGESAHRGLLARVMPVPKACRGLLASLPKPSNNDGGILFNTRVFRRSIPSMALRLWWQPVRHTIVAASLCRHMSCCSPHPSIPFPLSQFNPKGGGLIRKDIAAWL